MINNTFSESKYSFDVEINELSRPDVLIQIQLDKKLKNSDVYYSISEFIFDWETFSFYGGYKERLEKSHLLIYDETKKRKRIELALYIKPEHIATLKNLFHLLEFGWNQKQNISKNAKIKKVSVKSLDCYFMDYDDLKYGR